MSTDQQWDIVTGVGMTALAVAAGRAIESGKPDPLMTDPYARALVNAAQPDTPMPTAWDGLDAETGPEADMWQTTSEYIGVRSRVFDDYLTGAAGEGVTQLVILASGLDTRAFRLPWPSGTRCFELDQPAVLDFKLETLAAEGAAPRCEHRPVRVDLRDDWGSALEEAGFDRDRPTAWLAEGLLPYLPPEAEAHLFKEITRLSAPGSRLSVEQINDITGALDDPMMKETSDNLGLGLESLFPEGERTSVDAQLSALGWSLRHSPAPESAARYGRTLTASTLFSERIVHTFGEL
ncbi:class I SAM-dependent methyltransferase [Streptomyces sp. ODS28]|uniref:class I SAM-dependent methyltransferase n=1 Tax=Streptomyces sp. ODS28 TaxID=3136688 RepID=UPI0031EDC917